MRKIIMLIMSVLSIASLSAQGTLNAEQVMDKARAKITGAKGISADFSYFGAGQNGKGSLKVAGQKFMVTLSDADIWYNGKDMYTYNKRTAETTIMNPTAQELAEVNPLNYVKNSKELYTASFSAEKKAGKYIVELTPKKKGEIKKVVLTLRSSDFVPEKIVVTPSTGSALSVTVSSFKTLSSIAATEFEYPKTKYPKAEIVDLR